MKLKNKKTGVIATLTLSNNGESLLLMVDDEMLVYNVKLSELKEWEDYEEEPKRDYYYIDYNGTIKCFQYLDFDWQEEMKQIGNYFGTPEEAERAVEKLKAWKRLKDNGVEFSQGLVAFDLHGACGIQVYGHRNAEEDLEIIFGGEE